jgi:glutathione S-transferase
MSYSLIVGNPNYSSWSMRGWLLLKLASVPFDVTTIDLYGRTSRAEVRRLGGQSGRVPLLRHGDLAVWETLAIAEYLYESFPAIWPAAPAARARARSVSAEMFSGLHALREAMPVNLRARHRRVPMTPGLSADVARVEEIWTACLDAWSGPWLFGDYSAADVFFAPVATRFETYGIDPDGVAGAYLPRLLAHPHVVEWQALAGLDTSTLPQFEVGAV